MDKKIEAQIQVMNAAVDNLAGQLAETYGRAEDRPWVLQDQQFRGALRSAFAAGRSVGQEEAQQEREQEDRASRFAGLQAAIDDRLDVASETAKAMHDWIAPDTVQLGDIDRMTAWLNDLEELVANMRHDAEVMQGVER